MNKISSKMVITTPDLSKAGGVSIFVNAFKGRWNLEEIYFVRGGKGNNIFIKVILTIFDLFKFLWTAIKYRKEIFFINTSMNENAFKRDALFLNLLKILDIHPNVFIHGFKASFFQQLSYNQLKVLENSQNIFVLSQEHKDLICRKINFKNIYIETTVADEKFATFPFPEKKIEPTKLNILFLGRLENRKGIWQLLEAFESLDAEKLNISLEIVGHGTEEMAIKEWLRVKQLSNIKFSGKLMGEDKVKAYNRNQLFILPSDIEGEGLPITVIEAMFAGLVVLSTKAGGVVDFFQNDKMGTILDSNNSIEITEKIKYIASKTSNELENISNYNKQFANKNFRVDIVANRIKNIILNGTSKNN